MFCVTVDMEECKIVRLGVEGSLLKVSCPELPITTERLLIRSPL